MIELCRDRPPAAADATQELQRTAGALAEQVPVLDRQLPGEVFFERGDQLELVRGGVLDVDALHAVGVFAELLERNDDVLVDLEGVGMARDRGGARAVLPEALAR